MEQKVSVDFTLPSVAASSPGVKPRRALMLTIIFHPDTDRIGETAVFTKTTGAQPWVLGRLTPEFARPELACQAVGLGDAYVSRVALKLRAFKGDLLLQRAGTSSRCSVGGIDIGDQCTITGAQLRRGVPIMLGGRVVLLLRKAALPTAKFGPSAGHGLVGSSAYMRQLREQISKLAMVDLDVLLQGETGTGKELVAAALHGASKRATKPLVAVNMAAIPEALAPAALFGSARGAFTGAEKAARGYFEQADGSTLFLDEIGDTPQEVQPLLLRALQQREIQRVGGAITAVDIRVVSATDVALGDDQCGFKAALRYRLSQSELELAPLREHPEDIGEMLWTFVSRELCSMGRQHLLPQNQSTPNPIAQWADLFYRFAGFEWPGNVRQLLNCARGVAVASEHHLQMPDTTRKLVRPDRSEPEPQDSVAAQPKHYSDGEFAASFEQARYEVTRVAKALGLSRQAVYRRISENTDLWLASEIPADKIRAALRDAGGDHAAAAMRLKVSLAGLRERLRNTPQVASS